MPSVWLMPSAFGNLVDKLQSIYSRSLFILWHDAYVYFVYNISIRNRTIFE
jgi:hypothetical protein